ncbi:MAG: vanadium-dependent haloperoxidase [Caldilineaceae bacterium]
MAKLLGSRIRCSVQTLSIVLLLVASCFQPASAVSGGVAQYDAHVPLAWFNLYLRLVKETKGFAPPVASRTFGYAAIALYEAVVPGMPGYQSLAGQLTDLPPLPQLSPGRNYHWPTVANAALAEIARKFFAQASPENLMAINTLEKQLMNEYLSALGPNTLGASILQGRLIAGAIDAWAQTDGSTADNVAYKLPAGDGMWTPTPPKNLPALLPYWGNHRSFLKMDQTCKVTSPPAYSTAITSPFYAQAREVYDTVNRLTPEQRAIALFWADNAGETATPPGHSISILNQVLKEKQATLDVAAVAYAKVGIAVADAFVACWHTKYEYNLLRPITYIQKVIDPKWTTPDLVTPPFPEYTSGHSVQSAATAEVLTALFGDNYKFTDHTHEEQGLAPRTFASFWAAAQEAAISRLYGGIHYRAAIENGMEQGKCIGKQVNALKFNQ